MTEIDSNRLDAIADHEQQIQTKKSKFIELQVKRNIEASKNLERLEEGQFTNHNNFQQVSGKLDNTILNQEIQASALILNQKIMEKVLSKKERLKGIKNCLV